jgi:hypothetical protein
MNELSRRRFLVDGLSAAAGSLFSMHAVEAASQRKKLAADEHKALVAITLDLEMSRNFPTWGTTHWDYEKGNLNAPTKEYTAEACRRVRAQGGVIHCFAVGRVLEQENVDWLKAIVKTGHPVGNHTYDHVNVKAKKAADIQFRFQRAPWLIAGKAPREVIVENIRLTTAALQDRIGIKPAGFRTPGGFADGLTDRRDIQQMLLDVGFSWVSSKYPAHPVGHPGKEPPRAVYDAIVKAQAAAQPFVYPRGLVEIPMSPISDITAFRAGRWKLPWFLKAIRLAVEWAIANRAVFDFLGHPSCLYVMDPKFQTIELICDLVKKAEGKAALVDLDTIAERARLQKKSR